MSLFILKRLFHETPLSKLRNFCIIAHVDHGKSTLADRLMELTGAKPLSTNTSPSLDTLAVERARGITVKTQCVSMPYNGHLLTLMDTPGHIDFGGEVSRAVVGCEGAVVVVDASQGIQPQTMNNIRKAKSVGVGEFVAVVNKIDLETAQVGLVCDEVGKLLEMEPKDVIKISAKTGLNVRQVLDAIVTYCPSPKVSDGPLDCIILDSWYDEYRGVVCLVKVRSGTIAVNNTVFLASTCEQLTITQVGYLAPKLIPSPILPSGHIGYVMMAGVKSIRAVRVGDCLLETPHSAHSYSNQIILPKPIIFAGFFPKHSIDHQQLTKALDRLCLNDASVSVEKAHSVVLGAGFRLGFLGTLHMDVFRERLAGEFSAETIITAPTVTYKVEIGKETVMVNSPDQFPSDVNKKMTVYEPMCRVYMAGPSTSTEWMRRVITLIDDHRGMYIEPDYLTGSIQSVIPLQELIGSFHDQLQSMTSGQCSFDYEQCGYEPSDICLVKILLNGDPVDMLSFLSHLSTARTRALDLLSRLKHSLPRHQFDISLQASLHNRIIARETLSAMRKDVTAKCYGGDGTRKKKLLEQQRVGKEKLRQIGRVSIDAEALSNLMRVR